MASIPYRRTEKPGNDPASGVDFACPKCSGVLSRDHQGLTCGNCGYAPRHGAD